MSWSVAGDCALDAARSNGNGTVYIGYDKDMTRQFIADAASWARAYNLASSEINEFIFDDPDKDILAFTINFASGKSILALSSRPRNLRSKKGRVVLDELAFHDDPEALLKAAMALLIWGGRVDIISSVNGDSEFYEELCNVIAPARGYSVHTITFDDAIADGLYKRICLINGEQWTQEKEIVWREQIILEYGLDADEELFCIPSRRKGILAFNHFDRDRHVRPTQFDRRYPLCLSFDFNRSPATCVIGQQVGDRLNIIDEIYLLQSDTFALAAEARMRVQSIAPYLTFVYGDATGRIMTANSQQSNWDIVSQALQGLAINSRVPEGNPPVTDTLNSSNSLLYQDRVSIDPRCRELIKDLEVCKLLPDGKPDKKSDPLRFQVCDGFRYLAHGLFPYRSGGTKRAIVGGNIKVPRFG